jgi:hypothetical protein
MIDKYGNRGAVDLYTLGPGVTYKIYDANRLLLKRITFIHKDNSPLEPVVLANHGMRCNVCLQHMAGIATWHVGSGTAYLYIHNPY